jgi:sugar phosphate permease
MSEINRQPVAVSNALFDSTTSKPTKTRWVVLLLISLMYLITYVDRVNISVAAPAISREFKLSDTAIGIVFSAFLWAYSIGQIPGGWLADHFGPRKVLLTIVPFWSLMTGMTALATGMFSLIVMRFAFGLGEAGAFPTATRAMQLWFPKAERGLVQGTMHGFSRFAIAIVPFVAVPIMLAFGWRYIFYVCAAAGFVWSLVFYQFYRNRPEEHPNVNRAELDHIRGHHPDGTVKSSIALHARPAVPWKMILRSANMWYIAAGYCCFYYGSYFYITWFPTYLVEYRQLSLKAVGTFASLPLLAGMVGDVVGGTLTDTVYSKTHNLKLARRIVAAPAMLASAACLLPAATTLQASTAILCLTGSLFFLELVIGPAWAVPMDVGGEYSGTVTGIMNMAGSLAASVSPIIFGFLIQRGFWIAPFFISSGVLFTGALIWTFLIDPEVSVVESTFPKPQPLVQRV